MTSLKELDRRVTVLEGKVAMESEMHAAQDRDLSRLELKVDKIMDGLQALSLTVSDHNRKIDTLSGRMDRVEMKVDRLENKVDSIQGGVVTITGMLTQLIERDERN